MAKRRTPGSGSVYRRKGAKPGTKAWVAQQVLADGSKVQTLHLTKTDATKAAAKMISSGNTPKPKVDETAAAYLARWVAAGRARWAAKTYVEYARYVENVIAPALGTKKLAAVSRADARALFATLAGEGRSPRFQQLVRAIARKAWNDAIADDLVAVNPFARIDLGRQAQRELTVWTVEQLRVFLGAVADDPDGPLYAVAILTGLRAGELFALRPQDCDPARRTIHVGRSVSRVNKAIGFVVKPPKSGKGRTVTMHPLGFAALERQAALVEALRTNPRVRWDDDRGLVFPGRHGGYRSPSSARLKLARICDKLGLPVLRFHDLRHLHAALLIAVGAHAKAIQDALGHADITTTMGIYGHLMPGLGAAGSLAVGELLTVPRLTSGVEAESGGSEPLSAG